MQDDSLRQKWNRIYQDADLPARPCRILRDYSFLLPDKGTALDVACGMGGNAILLAGKGLQTLAWDLSDVAINRLGEYAKETELPLQAENIDINSKVLESHRFDVIVVCHYLDRDLFPAIISALNDNGLLFYQTFSIEAEAGQAPANPAFKLEVNELLSLCAPLRILAFMDLGNRAEPGHGFRNESFLIGQKSANNDIQGPG